MLKWDYEANTFDFLNIIQQEIVICVRCTFVLAAVGWKAEIYAKSTQVIWVFLAEEPVDLKWN